MYHCVCGECNIFVGASFEIKNRNCPKCGTRLQYVDHRIYEMWKNARIDEKKVSCVYDYSPCYGNDNWIDY